jgi:hypothetical protein
MVNDSIAYLYAKIESANNQVITLYELEKRAPFGVDNANPHGSAFLGGAAWRMPQAPCAICGIQLIALRQPDNEQGAAGPSRSGLQ